MIPIIQRLLFGNQENRRQTTGPTVINPVPPVQVINNGVPGPNPRRRVNNNGFNRNRGAQNQRVPVAPAQQQRLQVVPDHLQPGQTFEVMAPVDQVEQDLQPDPQPAGLEIVHPRYDQEFLRQVFMGTPRVTVLGSVEMDIFQHRKMRLPAVARYVRELRDCNFYPDAIVRLFLEVGWSELPIKMGTMLNKLVHRDCIFRFADTHRQLSNGLEILRKIAAGKKQSGGLYYPSFYDFVVLKQFFFRLNLHFVEEKFLPQGVVDQEFLFELQEQFLQLRDPGQQRGVN
jgi:hypothetical protein